MTARAARQSMRAGPAPRRARRRRVRAPVTVLAVLAAMLASTAAAQAESGLPIPRFVTVGASEANLRTGPGGRYPIEWVLVRRYMPVEVVGEFDTWRRVRDWEGVEGWVHQSLLSGRRGLVVIGDAVQALRTEPADTATMVARVEPGVIGRLLACPGPGRPRHGWCYCDIGGHRGWLPRQVVWGLYTDEEID